MNGRERKSRFVRALAEFLVEDQARKSIELQMGKPLAKEWAVLRSWTPLLGYPTVEEAEETLGDWLGIQKLMRPEGTKT